MIAAAPLLLSSYASDTYGVFRNICDKSIYQLKRSAAIYELWAGVRDMNAMHIGTITDTSLSTFLLERSDKYAQPYLRKIRGDLLTLLRAAADDGLCEAPRKVRVIAKVKPKPRAWTREQVERIVAASWDYNSESRNGFDLRTYFTALTMTAWDTGLRKGDLHRISQAMIGASGRITITQEKTDDEHYCRVSDDTLRLLRSIKRDKPLMWPTCACNFYYHWDRILSLAGVPRLGGMHALRKSATTEVARVHPGAETRFLGHTTPAADVHYIDRSLTADHSVMPTALCLPDAVDRADAALKRHAK